MKKKKALFILLVLIAAAAVGYLVYYVTGRAARSEIYDTLQNEVESKEIHTPVPTVTPQVTPTPKPTPQATQTPTPVLTVVPTTIDFQKLWDINPETAAWINVPGTKIDYPVMRSETDDTYYLNHTIEGASGYPGSIYMERVNKGDFSDYNVVLYGHNMKNGSMFADVRSYKDLTYMEKNHQIIIDTPEQKLTFEVFAAVTYSDAHILNTYDFNAKESRQSFLDSIFAAGGVYREDVKVDADSKLLTLSTCITSQPDKRYIVEAVLVNE